MKNLSYAKYYAANRNVLLERMRERSRLYAARRKEGMDSDPEYCEKVRAEYRAKYQAKKEAYARARIEEWLELPILTAGQKEFLTAMLGSQELKNLTKKAIDALEKSLRT